ncbi:MAG TPA: methyltransferase domain-containing protein [Candidatus Acidoferrum sp.]|nr:methyltransferase domain-containing protein [Candidatus Acidoferrum sp.]
MTMFARFQGALSYVRGCEPIYRWKIVTGRCPICGPTYFAVLKPDPFTTRCIKCRATVTNLSIISAIEKTIGSARGKTAFEMSSYGATWRYLRDTCAEFHFSEYFPGHKSGEWINGIRNEDATHLSFENETFDVITSNQVFEHIFEDRKAYQECFRTLKDDGSLLFTVPMHNTPRTEQVARLKNEQIEWLSAPEFHSSRTTGPNSVPVFWRYSLNDIVERVSSAGFSKVSIVDVMIVPQQINPQPVIYARK